MSSTALAFALALPAGLRRPLLWARLAVAGACVLLAIALARLVWLLVAGPALPLDGTDTPPPPGVAAEPAAAAEIAQWHLFGAAMPLAPQAADAPETALRLFLRGTVNEADPELGIAIIADADGGERAYRVGDALPGGAELTAIHAGRVLLSRAGVTEQLSLPRDAATHADVASAPAAARRSGAVPGGTPMPSFINPVISTGGPQIDAATRAALPDLERLAREVNVLPVIENGRFAGVRLAVGRDSDLLRRSGLKPTDIITAVNGIPLDGPQRQQQLVDSLKGSRDVQVTVRRDGKPMQLRVGLQ